MTKTIIICVYILFSIICCLRYILYYTEGHHQEKIDAVLVVGAILMLFFGPFIIMYCIIKYLRGDNTND